MCRCKIRKEKMILRMQLLNKASLLRFLSSLLLIIIPYCLSAQTSIAEANKIYRGTLYSVRFHPEGLPDAIPAYALNSSTRLILQFDDLVEDFVAYRYKIVHCNKDWTVSDLGFNEYMEGLDEQEIQDYDFSNNAGIPYTSYRLTIPNRNTIPIISGNYCLIVWDPYTDETVLTRRFFVVDNKVGAEIQLREPTRIDLIHTHHEFMVRVKYNKLRPTNPQRELSLMLIQNGRFDNALTDFKPSFFEGQAIRYDQVGTIVFPGGNEFRQLDIRSLGFRGAQMEGGYIDPEKGYIFNLKPDLPRDGAPHIFIEDLNGAYVIQAFETANSQVDPEYVWVRFLLKMNPLPSGQKPYVFGGLTDWSLHPAYQMEYDYEQGGYSTMLLLKQGFYHYQYAVDNKGVADLGVLEGDHFDTQNTYQLLVYYRPFGGRYDQLIGIGRAVSGG